MKSPTNRVLYYFFYLLFSVDTWRILIGFVLAAVFAPKLAADRGYTLGAEVVVWLMLIGIGYAAGNYPARLISKGLQGLFTPKR